MILNLNKEQFCEFVNIANGLFKPLNGFMNQKEYISVVENMCLPDGEVWTLPVTLDVDEKQFAEAKKKNKIECYYNNNFLGYIEIDDCFKVNFEKDLKKIFKTDDRNHPGVLFELKRGLYRIGGEVFLEKENVEDNFLNPANTKKIFQEKGWKTIAGFQTRNPIHRAHEYLQRIALELCDGLFINPLIGWKKKGDFSEKAVLQGYEAMIKNYYPENRVYFEPLITPMRYAGPREAIFHAIIRQNCGCTHFIIGRDHAGVGNYYEKYEAHKLAKKIITNNNLGIELLLLKGPYYCKKCKQIVTEKTCKHEEKYHIEISGTLIREMVTRKIDLDERFMRKEVADAIFSLKNEILIK